MSDEPAAAARVEVTAALDRHAAEALRLEVHRLARRHGLEITDEAPAAPRPSGG